MNNDTNINSLVKNKPNKKKTFNLVIALFTLMLCITGATFAYLLLTASNNAITGTVGEYSLELNVTRSLPVEDGDLVSQLEITLDRAISTDYNCVDGNGNVVCKVYKVEVVNTSGVAGPLTGTIRFTNIATTPNLKWKIIPDERTIGTDNARNATLEPVVFVDNEEFGVDEVKSYYLLFWIDETGSEQLDKGTFNAVIEFNGGITSTIVPDGVEAGAYYNDGTFKSWDTLVSEGTVTETSIPASAFEGVSELEKLVIPNTVTEIGDYALAGTSITSIAVPSSVTTLGVFIFDYGSLLTTVYYDGDSDALLIGSDNIDGLEIEVKSYDEAPIELIPIGSSEETELEPGVYDADGNMTYSWQYLLDNELVIITDGELSISSSPGISDYFAGKVVVPDTVTSIGSGTFETVGSSVTSVTLPKSVTNIKSTAFAHCEKLTYIDYLGTQTEWNSIVFGSDWNLSSSEITVHCTDGDIIIPAA